jgi:hypothetical protein
MPQAVSSWFAHNPNIPANPQADGDSMQTEPYTHGAVYDSIITPTRRNPGANSNNAFKLNMIENDNEDMEARRGGKSRG